MAPTDTLIVADPGLGRQSAGRGRLISNGYWVQAGFTARMMETARGLLRLALERGWTLGLLFLLFFGGAQLGTHYGLQLPQTVLEWSGAGILCGAAVIVVSAAVNIVAAIQRGLRRLQVRPSEN